MHPTPSPAAPEPPSQANLAAAPSQVHLEEQLLDVASQRTGYPSEMLSLDANPEADLGIDSIKRVEIIAAFRRATLPDLHEPPSWFMEEMTAAKTLRAIVAGVGWLRDQQARVASESASAPNTETVQVATPLLTGARVQRLPGGVVEAQVVLDPNRHAYLRDHMIENKPVLPLTVALELMAETAAVARPDWHVTQVADVRKFSGVTLDTNQRALVVRAEPARVDNAGGDWRVRLTDPRLPHRTLYEARVRLAAELPAAPAAPHLVLLAEAFPLNTQDAYDRWLFHGPRFRVIQQLDDLDHQGIDAVVQPASSHHVVGAHVRQGWLIDPIVLDSAAQLSMLWSRARHGVSTLPSLVDTYHRYGALGSDPLRMVWRVDQGTDQHTVKAKVWFLRGGQVVGHLDGLEGHGNAELNRITGVLAR